ncbi:unnamed protein product [Vitrella brassicaformis CCMP3155]|uniref:Fe2OG dioxygenase domain-containing protein n=1 Tax=Vitrella brassicaformis (strain CCMP3155) TaxID=1169540 RepID=A0A0G4EML5_VITBC|nr:unnamed protein product [Vitrella brassicaformis CCMP3155]|mmetsp:Transcript_25072/g.72362  ORF Transcript_25072/g.72362 Transcript_25072/m.72362 type:complete len:524 (-) Transcript_25072:1681-3252(-)|eukprot:CEL98252.1 unnamed protein product [Vitrella brassicaformis CCMP3155]
MVVWVLLLTSMLLPFILPSATGFLLPRPSSQLRAPAAQKVTRLSQEQQREAYDWALPHIKDIVSPPFFIEGTIDGVVPVIRGKTRDWALDLSENQDMMIRKLLREYSWSYNWNLLSEESLKAAYASANQSPVGLLGEEPGDRVDFEHRKSREFATSDLHIQGTVAPWTSEQYRGNLEEGLRFNVTDRTNGTWTAVIEEICQEVANRLSPGSEVKAELYKMLIYSEGDHFAKHVDTQRSADMFATLIVSLPTEYKGGAFTLWKDGEAHKTSDSTYRQTWVAFFSDVPHSVETVTSGYRCVLVYNLSRRQVGRREKRRSKITEKFVGSLKKWFQEKDREALAIALEYQYTPSSIGVEYLKGRDRLLYDILAEHFNVSLEIVHQNWRALPADDDFDDEDEDYDSYEDPDYECPVLCGMDIVDPRYLELLDESNDKKAWRWFLALEDDELCSDYIEKFGKRKPLVGLNIGRQGGAFQPDDREIEGRTGPTFAKKPQTIKREMVRLGNQMGLVHFQYLSVALVIHGIA